MNPGNHSATPSKIGLSGERGKERGDSGKIQEEGESAGSLKEILFLGCLAVFGGLLVGIVGSAFRFGLTIAENGRCALISWASQWPFAGWLFPVFLGLFSAAVARYFVGKYPLASGSGIPHVEAILRGQSSPVRLDVLAVKFFGGIASIGGGLALGREGPTIQMGSILGTELARIARLPLHILRELQAALGGAGLGVAFNAPIGGAFFVFEEVVRSFRPRLVLLTMGGLAGALLTSQSLLGNAPVFPVGKTEFLLFWQVLLCVFLGGILGLAGVFYNRAILFAMDVLPRWRAVRPEWKAGCVGALAGGIGWFYPSAAGSGEILANEWFASPPAGGLLLLLLLLRWAFGPLSYACGTPGGLFAPLLLVGAGGGFLFSIFFNSCAPTGWEIPSASFAVVGMASFFAGTVRAPFTGIALITEMTGAFPLLLPMLAAVFFAQLVAEATGETPIYDSLRKKMLADSPKSPTHPCPAGQAV